MTTTLDLTIHQGETFAFSFPPILNPDGTPNSTLLTGAIASMMLRRRYEDPGPLISLLSPSSGLVVTPGTGLITATIPAANTTRLQQGKGVYTLKLLLVDAVTVVYPYDGSFTVFPTATRVTP